MPTLLNTRQVAERLGVDVKTVLRYLRSGRLKGSRLGRDYRISEESLNALLQTEQPAKNGPVTRFARITAVVNQKGGVGKTTTTFHVGVALARAGKRVLLVDLDPQAALSASAGISIAHLTRSIYQVLIEDTTDPESVIHHAISGVDVLPATLDLAGAELELASAISRESILKDQLAKIRSQYDHVLLDCPPNLGLLTINALAAADQVLIPLQCEYLAVRGLAQLLKTLDRIRARLNRNLTVVGILPTRFKANTTNSNEILAELKANFPNQIFEQVIRESVRMQEAPAAGLSIFDYDKRNAAAEAYAKVAAEVDHA